MLRAVLEHRVRVLEWLRALAVRCIQHGRSLVEQAVVQAVRASLRDRVLVRAVLGLGTGQGLLRVG